MPMNRRAIGTALLSLAALRTTSARARRCSRRVTRVRRDGPDRGAAADRRLRAPPSRSCRSTTASPAASSCTSTSSLKAAKRPTCCGARRWTCRSSWSTTATHCATRARMRRSLPRWAVWKHEAYGTTYEPVGMAYHRKQLADARGSANACGAGGAVASRTRSAFAAASPPTTSNAPAWFPDGGPRCDGHTAFLGAGAFARCLPGQPACRHASMLESVAAGRSLLAYNVLGTYAEAFAAAQPRRRRGLPERLHAGAVARGFHRAQRAEPAGCPLVARPPAFAAGPAAAGGRRRAVQRAHRFGPAPVGPRGRAANSAPRPGRSHSGRGCLRISTAASMRRC